ncbi:MAG: thioredoxin family protein [Acidobacteriaceae bacterium]|nr:thioredoxin family protein [Acidobacteriaceae bacterium]
MHHAKRIRLTLMVAACSAALCFAKEDPVQWTLIPVNGTSEVAPGGNAWFELKATIQPGWHLYSPTTPPGGPIITKLTLTPNASITGKTFYRPQPARKLDPNFNIDTETYSGNAVFLLQVVTSKSVPGKVPVEANARYQACSDVKCLPPVKKSVAAELSVVAGAAAVSFALPAGYIPVAGSSDSTTTTKATTTPVVFGSSNASRDLLPFLLTAFGFGLAALFTPCVFPMIPITVSFFLNQDIEKRSAWRQALLFCVGIVVLFTGLGVLVTAITGPFGVVQLGSSPWVNSFIALVFFAFGLSLLGAFELRLPSGLVTSLDRASQGGGYAGTLLMGLTFSLTSFACIGPIVGPLLIASVQSKGFEPVLGMMSFATGLAAPFFLLALFPSYMQRLPRSGIWMVRVKVVLGFIVLAVMLKYISNVDQVLQTHWLSRERFLAAWIVLFALPGLYLFGILRMEGVNKDQPVGVTRALVAALFLIFAISLVPGLFGARLGDLDAFVPEGSGVSLAGTGTETATGTCFKNDLDAALQSAREQNKLVLVNFTGYACTNCHWMKANMFTRSEIQAVLKNLVVVDLYTDGTDAESEKNQKLEDQKFGTASIPFYALMDAEQNVIATFPQLTHNVQEFRAFLEKRPVAARG